MPLPTRKLGSSDLEVPLVCLGTMTWGNQNSQEEAFEQMDLALKRGCNFWDTAELYPVPVGEYCGTTEEMIGNYFAARGCRDKVVLATKIAGPWPDRKFLSAKRTDPPTPIDQAPEIRVDAASIRSACEGSLRRLQTTYIDLYQIHWPDRYCPVFGKRQYRLDSEREDFSSFDEQVLAIGDLIKEGKIRHWGLSNETAFGVCKFVEAAKRLGVPPPITIQNDFNLMDRVFEEETAEACAPRFGNVSLLAWGPLAGGTLTGKYLGGEQPKRARHTLHPNFQPRYHSPKALEACEEYAELAKSKGISLTEMSLAWCASRWYMGSVIIGATTVEQLAEDLDVFEQGLVLDEETLAGIDAIHRRRRNPLHTD